GGSFGLVAFPFGKHAGDAVSGVKGPGEGVGIFGEIERTDVLLIARVGTMAGDGLNFKNLEIGGAAFIRDDVKFVKAIGKGDAIESPGKEIDDRRAKEFEAGSINAAVEGSLL